MTLLRLAIVIYLLVLICGQLALWRRRDNVLGYIQAGLFLTTYLLPLAATNVLGEFDDRVVTLYARILALGAAGFTLGLIVGARLGTRGSDQPPLTFVEPLLERGPTLRRVAVRTRVVATAGVVSMAAAYVILGYVPLLAGDRVSAKYGVGAYAAAFARGGPFYNFALVVASTVLPVALALLVRRRRRIDLALSGALLLGLVLTLSRTLAFTGVLLFAVAMAVERRIKPVIILGATTAAFLAGALFNEIFLAEGAAEGGLAGRVANSSPDVREHLSFLRGFEEQQEYRRGWAILGGLAIGRGDLDPATYTIRVITGADDVSQFVSGGLRLPAPVWGYASFGLAGAALWSLLSGLFTGWGTTRLRNLLTGVLGAEGAALSLVLAATFYAGTFGIAAGFYFANTSMIVRLALAIYLGHLLVGLQRYLPFEPPAEEAASTVSQRSLPARLARVLSGLHQR
jgi:MFS family permease